MLARDLITDEIPPLKTTDTGDKALSWMEEFKVSHLPIINKTEYLGLLTDTDVFDLNNPEKTLSKYKLSLIRPFVLEHQHAYEVIRLAAEMKLSVVPVLTEEQHYLGCIPQSQIIQYFSKAASVQQPGGILVLEVNYNDFSMTQISSIIEGNDAKILSCHVSGHTDSTKLDITIKVNKEDITAILQTFYRFNYTVKASYHQSRHWEDIKGRFDQFMNYINI